MISNISQNMLFWKYVVIVTNIYLKQLPLAMNVEGMLLMECILMKENVTNVMQITMNIFSL